jgi:hypothetical protein
VVKARITKGTQNTKSFEVKDKAVANGEAMKVVKRGWRIKS